MYENRYYFESYMLNPTTGKHIIFYKQHGSFLTEDNMAKKIENNVVAENAVINVEVAKAQPTNTALSIVYNGNKKYSVIKVKFNPEVGNVGSVEVIENNLDLYQSHAVFKAETVKAGLFDQGVDK
jgi:hypothetical protein